MNDAKMIRFIDSEYNDLFFIPDGANIILTFSNGEKVTRPCKYLDSHHTRVGSEALHICQFAEIMERNGTTYMPEHPPELPDKCFSTMPVSGELVLIEKGKKGYIPCPWCSPEQAEREAAQRNRSLGVTKQQEAAMLGGSMFGWQTHVSDVSSYDLKGQPVYPSVQTVLLENSGGERRDDYLRSSEMSTEANYNMVDGIINNTPPPREDQTYSIYQLKSGDETRDYRFESLGHLEARGLSVDPALYTLVYTTPLTDRDTLDSIFQKFNIDHPSDFTGHSLSVSDIIVLRKKDETTAYYVDAFGFREVPFNTVDKEVTIVDDEKRMIQNYEVKTAIHIGGKEIILAEDLASSEPYMVCNCQWDNPLGADIYDKAEASADYIEAMTEFLGRVASEVEQLQDRRTERGVTGEPLTVADCIPGSSSANYENQLVVIKPDKMVASARTADEQLLFAVSGNGCSPDARGQAVFCKNLFTGKTVRWERTDVAGIILPGRIPAWAHEKLQGLGIAVQQPALPKVYMASLAEARQNGELEVYRESRKHNAACAKSIEKAINDSHNWQYSFDMAAALKAVTAEFGIERVHVVLANTVQYLDYDGRFSHGNKQWAQGVQLPQLTKEQRADFVCGAHPALLDGFLNTVRKQQQEKKPSVTDLLKAQPKAPSRSPSQGKKAKCHDEQGR